MENGLQKFGGDGKITNLWKQPGGTLAKVGLWVMGGSVLWGIYKALPYLIAFTQNVFTLTLLMLGLGCILYVVFSPEMRKILKLLYLQICRKITGLIVEIDPIAILENSINEMKKKLLGVDAECLEQFGAVSHETAVQMAEKCRARLGTDLALSVTGLAGPGDDGVHTVGTVFVALAAAEGTYVRRLYKDKWGRERIKHAAANHAFDMIRRYLEGLPVEYIEDK